VRCRLNSVGIDTRIGLGLRRKNFFDRGLNHRRPRLTP
jgi:hypothetical protein